MINNTSFSSGAFFKYSLKRLIASRTLLITLVVVEDLRTQNTGPSQIPGPSQFIINIEVILNCLKELALKTVKMYIHS